jgi:thioredoxin reductase (NADPH)
MMAEIKNKSEIHDLIIIGAGPAGLAAGIYGARYRMKVLIFGKELGGACTTAHKVENYPGFTSILGQDLMHKFAEHTKSYGVSILPEEVKGVTKDGQDFFVHTAEKKYQTRAVILSLGTQRRKLNIYGEKEFLGRGVSYCATCDCRFFKNKKVAVVGGSDAAVTAALLLAEYAQKVYVILRRGEFRAEPVWIERLSQNQKIEKILNTQVLKILGDKIINGIEIDPSYHGHKILPLDGVFIEIGTVPAVSLAKGLGIKTTPAQLIEVDKACATNIAGCFAAGDTTNASLLKQIITAAAQGAIAATSAYQYIQKLKT